MLKYLPITKIDASTHSIWGVATSDKPDKSGEICDYPAAKKAFLDWSKEFEERTTAAGLARSLGCLRVQHGLQVAGKITELHFDDVLKRISVGCELSTSEIWDLVERGILNALSIGGSCLWKRPEGEYVRFAPIISELSLCDNPCNPDSVIQWVKADGTSGLRKSAKRNNNMANALHDHFLEEAAHHRQQAATFSKLSKNHTARADACENLATQIIESGGRWTDADGSSTSMAIDNDTSRQKSAKVAAGFYSEFFGEPSPSGYTGDAGGPSGGL